MYVTIISKEKKEYQLESWGHGRGLRERLWKRVGERKEGENSDTINQKDIGILMSKY